MASGAAWQVVRRSENFTYGDAFRTTTTTFPSVMAAITPTIGQIEAYRINFNDAILAFSGATSRAQAESDRTPEQLIDECVAFYKQTLTALRVAEFALSRFQAVLKFCDLGSDPSSAERILARGGAEDGEVQKSRDIGRHLALANQRLLELSAGLTEKVEILRQAQRDLAVLLTEALELQNPRGIWTSIVDAVKRESSLLQKALADYTPATEAALAEQFPFPTDEQLAPYNPPALDGIGLTDAELAAALGAAEVTE